VNINLATFRTCRIISFLPLYEDQAALGPWV